MAMTPTSIAKAVPAIQQAAESQVNQVLAASGDEVKMEEVCNTFTLDVAWKQILGLDLLEEEVPLFREKVREWMDGSLDVRLLMPFKVPGLKQMKVYKAREYLVSKVERKIEQLERDGPDSSTLSGLLYASDNEASGKKLTHEEVIDNALILILAGSETSSSTLTVAMQVLGMHPNIWSQIKKEQQELVAEFGKEMTLAQLDRNCPVLESVIKEVMRIRPISTLEYRRARRSHVVEGQQIPKGWMAAINVFLTHEKDPAVQEKDGSHMDLKSGFKPERWQDDISRPTEYFPFGYGGRHCLGATLAMAEMKIFLASMARRVDFNLVNPSNKVLWKKMSFMPRPKDGVLVSPRMADLAM
mmetsp:Transcript_30186/g.61563  ORF Transcript_30186/g.61563 Transcript_30186/m.61563 type:complete len:357 (-) Transcript_30186:18-1088(-)